MTPVTSSSVGRLIRAFVLVLSPAALPVRADILYDAALDAYRVTDYPEQYPCTLELLAEMDRLLGVGKAAYDAAGQTCTLQCDLVIGDNKGRNAYFQIGCASRPRETLVIHGNIWVCPYFVTGENPEKYWWHAAAHTNRLSVGNPDDNSVHASILFGAGPGNKRFCLVTGERPHPNEKPGFGRGGQLMAWNGLISAAKQEKGGEIGGLRLRGDGFVFVNSTLSWVQGMMGYGASPGWRKTIRVENSTFAHGGTAVVGGQHCWTNCRIIDCGTAVLDYGSVDVTLRNCILQRNQCNWHLRFPGKRAGTLACIDCTIEPPLRGNTMELHQTQSIKALRDKGIALHNPRLFDLRHVVVAVRDPAGKPVADAVVAVHAEQPGSEVDEGRRYRTNKDGRTPGKGESDAILLPLRREDAVTKGEAPSVTDFTYSITVTANGKNTTVTKVRPLRSWKQVALTLE